MGLSLELLTLNLVFEAISAFTESFLLTELSSCFQEGGLVWMEKTGNLWESSFGPSLAETEEPVPLHLCVCVGGGDSEWGEGIPGRWFPPAQADTVA